MWRMRRALAAWLAVALVAGTTTTGTVLAQATQATPPPAPTATTTSETIAAAGPAAEEARVRARAGAPEARVRAQIEALFQRLGVLGAGAPAARLCGWIWVVSAQTLNVAAPDTHSTYWVQPYVLGPQRELVIHGEYPFARYFSFTAYASNGLPINNVSLHDAEIAPDAGSVNPFTTPDAPTDPNRRRYTLRVVPAAAAAPNTLAGVPTGQDAGFGFLVYRLYLPTTPHDPAGGVPLPRLTTAAGPLRPCTPAERTQYNELLAPLADYLVTSSAPDPATVARGAALFRRAPSLAGLFPNPDNQYLLEASDWAPGLVVVIRGKGFTFPDTRHGVPVTTPAQVRYWSMCSNELADPYPAVQCAADDETVLDAQGFYTYAISMPQDRPANATAAHGVTWLPWAAAPPAGASAQVPPNTAYLRTMLPAPGFTQAAQGVPAPAPGATAQALAAQAAAAMGPYYPVGAACSKSQFETQGPLSCFPAAASRREPPPERPPRGRSGAQGTPPARRGGRNTRRALLRSRRARSGRAPSATYFSPTGRVAGGAADRQRRGSGRPARSVGRRCPRAAAIRTRPGER